MIAHAALAHADRREIESVELPLADLEPATHLPTRQDRLADDGVVRRPQGTPGMLDAFGHVRHIRPSWLSGDVEPTQRATWH